MCTCDKRTTDLSTDDYCCKLTASIPPVRTGVPACRYEKGKFYSAWPSRRPLHRWKIQRGSDAKVTDQLARRLDCGAFCVVGGSTPTPCTYTISPPSHPETPRPAIVIRESTTGTIAPGAPFHRSAKLTTNKTTASRLRIRWYVPIRFVCGSRSER